MTTTLSRSFKKQPHIQNLTINTNVPEVEAPRSSKSRSPFCGVCFKAKQPSSIYNSHWTRMNPNPRSPITCPLILKTVCKYCKQTGHTAKYCPVSAKKEQRRRRSRASSLASNASSQSGSVMSISSSPAPEKGSWLQAAMKTEPPPRDDKPRKEPEANLTLQHPSSMDGHSDFPSPPKLQRSRARWDWNADFESDSD